MIRHMARSAASGALGVITAAVLWSFATRRNERRDMSAQTLAKHREHIGADR